jgi:hypothetical protein
LLFQDGDGVLANQPLHKARWPENGVGHLGSNQILLNVMLEIHQGHVGVLVVGAHDGEKDKMPYLGSPCRIDQGNFAIPVHLTGAEGIGHPHRGTVDHRLDAFHRGVEGAGLKQVSHLQVSAPFT